MKYLILVGDGMGDHPIPELGDRTPLQSAATPAMDRLCKKSAVLELATVPAGFHPGSDVANMSLLGYDPVKYYTGRAPLEAASMAISLDPDQTAFRCNLVTLDRIGNRATMIDFSAGHISTGEAVELISAIQDECGDERFQFHSGISYRHLLVVRDPIPDMTAVPPHDYIGKDVTEPFQAYLDLPDWGPLVLKAEKILAEHPLNRKRLERGERPATSIWPWGCGKMPAMPTLQQRFNLSGTMISAVDLLKGLGVCAGLHIAEVKGATGYIDTNYEGKARAALEALQDQDFVFVHLEAPDEAGHQGRLDHKIKAIEDFDRKIVDRIIGALEGYAEPFRAVVTMDHYTPLSIRTHTAEPVPALLYDSRANVANAASSFDERLLHSGNGYERVVGYNLINHLLDEEDSHD